MNLNYTIQTIVAVRSAPAKGRPYLRLRPAWGLVNLWLASVGNAAPGWLSVVKHSASKHRQSLSKMGLDGYLFLGWIVEWWWKEKRVLCFGSYCGLAALQESQSSPPSSFQNSFEEMVRFSSRSFRPISMFCFWTSSNWSHQSLFDLEVESLMELSKFKSLESFIDWIHWISSCLIRLYSTVLIFRSHFCKGTKAASYIKDSTSLDSYCLLHSRHAELLRRSG